MNQQQHEPESVAEDGRIIGKAFRWSLAVIAVAALGVAISLWVVRQPGLQTTTVAESPVVGPKMEDLNAAAQPPSVLFTDVTEQSGIDFVHVNGAYGQRLLPETMGSGVAFFDYDKDGDADLLLVNSDIWPEKQEPDTARPTMALYANDGQGRFSEVTQAAGLDHPVYGMGVAVADYDGDGWADVFISAVGTNRLFRNARGRFEDVTGLSGVGGDAAQWSTSSAFFDYDKDGDLDLFVASYVKWSRDIDLAVDYQLTGIGRAYGPPTSYEGTRSYLYCNNGDGTFSDVSEEARIHVSNPATGLPMGKALAIVPIDADWDGAVDLLVANDTVQNFFFHNQGDGTFEESGVMWGLAFDRNGHATGAMGADAAFYRNSSDLGFAVGNFANEMTSLYVSQGDSRQFADESIVDGVGPASRLKLSFGLFFFDYDLDGRLDMLQANGHVENEINTVQSSQHYKQQPQLFWNCGEDCPATFVPVENAQAGALNHALVGRGASFADIDGDGDLDVVISQVGGRPLLLRNDQDLGHHWVRIQLAGTGPNQEAIGARLELKSGDTTQYRQIMPTRSYLSQTELPATFGLGELTQIDRLTIHWPDGSTQVLTDLAIDRTHRIEQGR